MTTEQPHDVPESSAEIETLDSPQNDSKPTMMDWALRYAVNQWRVLPIYTVHDGLCTCGNPACPSPGKHPVSRLVPHGVLDATDDPETIRAWWGQYPDAGIGTAILKDIVVIDVDVHDGKPLEDKLTQLGKLPFTVRARTGGGGVHLYTKVPPGVRLKGKFEGLTSIDVRKEGNYVILPPSKHPGGSTYSWEVLPFKNPIADLPAHLLELVREKPRKKHQPYPVEPEHRDGVMEYLVNQALEKCEQGDGRNNTGLWLACQLRDNGLDETEAEPIMLDYAAQANAFGDGEYAEGEALGSLTQAYRREPREPMTFSQDSPPPSQTTSQREIAPKSLKDLLHTEIPPIQWAVPGLIPQGLTILAGKPKVGKSWLALSLVLAVGSGGRALGQVQCEKGNVLYLALEDNPRRLKERTKKLLGSEAANWNGTVDFETEWERLDKGGYDRLDSYLTTHAGTRFVVIDTFAKIRPSIRSKSGVSYDEDYAAMSQLKRLADQHGTAIKVIHHTRKGQSDDPQDMVSGTTGLTGAADSTMVLSRSRIENSGTLFMTGRDIEEQELALMWNGMVGSWVVTGESAEALQLTALQRKVVAFFRSRDWKPCRKVEALRGAGLDDSRGGKGYKVLERMERDGSLVRSGAENVRIASYLQDTPSTTYNTSTTYTTYTTSTTDDSRPAVPMLPAVDAVDVVDMPHTHRVYPHIGGFLQCNACPQHWAVDDLPAGCERFGGFDADNEPTYETWDGHDWHKHASDEDDLPIYEG